jgi:xanthine/uracil permease
MSLLRFHIVLITAAILLSAGLGFWALREYGAAPDAMTALMAAASFFLGAVLAVYLTWFITKKLPRFKK